MVNLTNVQSYNLIHKKCAIFFFFALKLWSLTQLQFPFPFFCKATTCRLRSFLEATSWHNRQRMHNGYKKKKRKKELHFASKNAFTDMTGRWRWDRAATVVDTDWWQNNTVRMEPLSHCALHTARTPATSKSKTWWNQFHRLSGTQREINRKTLEKVGLRRKSVNLAVAPFASKGGQIFTQSSIGLTEATQAHTQLPSPREAGSNSQVTFERSDIWLRDNWPNSWLMFKCCCRAWTLGTTNPNFFPLGFGSHVAAATVVVWAIFYLIIRAFFKEHSISNPWLRFLVCGCSRNNMSSLLFGLRSQNLLTTAAREHLTTVKMIYFFLNFKN